MSAGGKVPSGGKGHGKNIGGSGRKKLSSVVSKSERAGLLFPVGRIQSYLKRARHAKRIGAGAPVYLAAVLEYLCSEVLLLAGDKAIELHTQRIMPRHILLSVAGDDELAVLFSKVTIAHAGVVPTPKDDMMPSKLRKKKNKSKTSGPNRDDPVDDEDDDEGESPGEDDDDEGMARDGA